MKYEKIQAKKKIEENHLSFIKQNKIIITTKKPLKTKITTKNKKKPPKKQKNKKKEKKKRKKKKIPSFRNVCLHELSFLRDGIYKLPVKAYTLPNTNRPTYSVFRLCSWLLKIIQAWICRYLLIQPTRNILPQLSMPVCVNIIYTVYLKKGGGGDNQRL